MFGILAAVVALECAFELWSWRRGNGSLITALGLAGMSLLMLCFFSRQRLVRWVAYILGTALILLRLGAYITNAFLS